MKPSNYRPELDVLRFAAFGLVFAHHLLPQKGPLGFVTQSCGFGLPLFFTLSAFLIAGNLAREKRETDRVDVKSFYRRRCLRIWPLYFSALAAAAGFDLATGFLDAAHVRLLTSLTTFTSDIYLTTSQVPWINDLAQPLWSISVEEQFYLLYPLLVVRLDARGQWITNLVIMTIAATSQAVMGALHMERDHVIWSSPLVQMEFLAVGAMLALALRDRQALIGAVGRATLIVSAVGLWLLASLATGCKQPGRAPSGVSVVVGYQLVALGCIAAILSLQGVKSAMPRLLTWLGSISFGLYVFHTCGLLVAKTLVDGSLAMEAALAFGVTVAMAAISYRYLETPFLGLPSGKPLGMRRASATGSATSPSRSLQSALS